jgi:hypothetical protein
LAYPKPRGVLVPKSTKDLTFQNCAISVALNDLVDPSEVLFNESSIHVKGNVSGAGWEAVIEDAEGQLRALKQRQACLRNSIETFRKKMKAGEPLPEGLPPSTQT